MLNHRSALALAAITAVMLSACSSGTTTTNNVIATGTVTATFMNSNSKPVIGATVAITPDVSAIVAPCPVTGGDGTWSCNLPSGVYTLTVSGTGVTRTAFTNVATVLAGQTAALGVKTVPYSPIVLTVATPPNPAGFGMPVSLTATATGGTGALTYTWGTSGKVTRAAPAAWSKAKAYTQYVRVSNGGNVYECATSGTSAASGTGPSGTAAGIADGTATWNYLGALAAGPAITGTGAAGSFTTETFSFLANPANLIVRNQDVPNRPGLVGLTVGDGEYMAYTVAVSVSDGTYTQNTTVTVNPASFTHGTSNNPVGAMIIATDGDPASNVAYGISNTVYAWTLDGKPSGSTATLHGADTQNPWFIADVPGDYTLNSNAVPAWAPSTAYVSGNYVKANGNIYKISTAGTSAASGSGPSGIGTIPTDGTAKWTFQVASPPIVVHADTFSGVAACGTCHGAGGMAPAPKAQYAAWGTSAHAVDPDLNNGASLFQNELSGLEHGGATCIRCHTTGNDPGEHGNLGFSELAAQDGWVYPAGTVAWSTVPANLKALDGVQCESCHGPVGITRVGGGHVPAVSYNASLCGRCHDYNVGSHHDRYSLWSMSPTGHSLRSLALRGAADRSPVNLTADATTGYLSYGAGSCARCHTAQGFAAYVKQQLTGGATDASDPCYGAASGDYSANASCFLNDPSLAVTQQTTAGLQAYLTSTLGLTAGNVEPQTCQACHDPHNTGLRLEDDTHVLPGGFRVRNAGAGALCMMCHNSRNGARGDAITLFPKSSYKINGSNTAIRTVGSPHDSTAADLFSGNNLFFTDAYVQKTGKHLQFVEGTCVGCHVNINVGGESLQSKAPNHAFKVDDTICATCHAAAADALTDPSTGIQATFDAMMGTSTTGLSGSIASAYMAAITRFQTGSQGNVQIIGSTGNQIADFPLSNIQSVTGPAVDNQARGPNDAQVLITFATPVLDPTKSIASGTTMTTYSASMTALVWKTTDQTGATVAGRPIFDPAGLLQRAIYNNALLTRDMSKGVHNWSYIQNGIANTKAALDAYANSGTLPSSVTAP